MNSNDIKNINDGSKILSELYKGVIDSFRQGEEAYWNKNKKRTDVSKEEFEKMEDMHKSTLIICDRLQEVVDRSMTRMEYSSILMLAKIGLSNFAKLPREAFSNDFNDMLDVARKAVDKHSEICERIVKEEYLKFKANSNKDDEKKGEGKKGE